MQKENCWHTGLSSDKQTNTNKQTNKHKQTNKEHLPITSLPIHLVKYDYKGLVKVGFN